MENQIPIVPVVAPQIVVQQPKQSNFLVILLSVLLLISVSIAGYFAYQTQRLVNELRVMSNESKQISEPTFEPGLEPEPIPLEIITKDWKTYTNTKYKYTFKYPLEAVISDVKEGGLDPISESSKGVNLRLSDKHSFQIEVDDANNLSRGSYDEWLKTLKTSQFYKVTNESTIIIDGVTATVVEGAHVNTYQKTYFFQSLNGANFFSLGVQDTLTQNQKMLSDQILSTFKFTN